LKPASTNQPQKLGGQYEIFGLGWKRIGNLRAISNLTWHRSIGSWRARKTRRWRRLARPEKQLAYLSSLFMCAPFLPIQNEQHPIV